jgi:hypothetical protein
MVLQWSYSGVTVVLPWCYRGVTVVLQWCYIGVPVVSQWWVTERTSQLNWRKFDFKKKKK